MSSDNLLTALLVFGCDGTSDTVKQCVLLLSHLIIFSHDPAKQVNNKLSNPFTSTGVVTLSFIHGDRAAHPLSCWNCCLWTILDLKMPTTLSFTVHSLALVFRREGKERRLCAKGAAFFNKWDTSKLKMRLAKWKMKKGTPAECRSIKQSRPQHLYLVP